MPLSSLSKEDLRFLLPGDSLLARIPLFASSSPPYSVLLTPSAFPRGRLPALAALSSGPHPSASSKVHHLLWNRFNRFVRLHCERRASIGFGSLSVSSDDIRLDDEVPAVVEDGGVPFNGAAEFERPKKVLILMSDTGGGHRASAEAIKAAFNQEFGDEYQIFVTDLWTNHTPWPFNQLPRSLFGKAWRFVDNGVLCLRPSLGASTTFCCNFNIYCSPGSKIQLTRHHINDGRKLPKFSNPDPMDASFHVSNVMLYLVVQIRPTGRDYQVRSALSFCVGQWAGYGKKSLGCWKENAFFFPEEYRNAESKALQFGKAKSKDHAPE